MLLGLGGCADDGSSRAEGGASLGEGSSAGDEAGPSTGVDASTDAGSGDGSGDGTTGVAVGSTGADDGTTGDGGVPGAWCGPVPLCEAPLPMLPTLSWNSLVSEATVALGSPNHRGRDFFYLEGDDQWVVGKFSYGITDKDIHGERVDVYVLRDCLGQFELLGTATTTDDGSHPTVEGVEDSGGRVYFQIPEAARLGLGRHRIHFVVRGDDSRTDAFIEVVPPGTPIIVSDVDGTLTTSETEEYGALLGGTTPEVQPGAPEALGALVDAGYHIMYLTARPEFLVGRTREFVQQRGLPRGLVHTTLGLTGALGSAAVGFKSGELEALAARSLVPSYAFGNTSSDGDAYENAGIAPLDRRIFVQYDDTWGGRRIESYEELVPEFEAVDDLCP